VYSVEIAVAKYRIRVTPFPEFSAEPDTLPVPLEPFKSKQSSDKHDRLNMGLRDVVRWATTPPQAVAVYLICLILVAGLSFYVGTLKPKAIGLGPPPMSAPRN
jgi:hypothetical protein